MTFEGSIWKEKRGIGAAAERLSTMCIFIKFLQSTFLLRRHIHIDDICEINTSTKTRYWFSSARQLYRGCAPVHWAATDCLGPSSKNTTLCWVINSSNESTDICQTNSTACYGAEKADFKKLGQFVAVVMLLCEVVWTCPKWPMCENVQPDRQLQCGFSEDCS